MKYMLFKKLKEWIKIYLRKNLNEFTNELMLDDKIVPKLLNFVKNKNGGEYVPLLYSLCTRLDESNYLNLANEQSDRW